MKVLCTLIITAICLLETIALPIKSGKFNGIYRKVVIPDTNHKTFDNYDTKSWRNNAFTSIIKSYKSNVKSMANKVMAKVATGIGGPHDVELFTKNAQATKNDAKFHKEAASILFKAKKGDVLQRSPSGHYIHNHGNMYEIKAGHRQRPTDNPHYVSPVQADMLQKATGAHSAGEGSARGAHTAKEGSSKGAHSVKEGSSRGAHSASEGSSREAHAAHEGSSSGGPYVAKAVSPSKKTN